MQTSSKLQKPQSELSRKMQTVPGISLTSIRMVSTRPLCQGARRNTDKNTQHICRQSQQGQIRRAQGFRRSQSFQSHRARGFRQRQSFHSRQKRSVQRFRQEWSLSKLRSRSCETSSGRSGGLRNSGGGRRPTHSAGKSNYGRSCSRI